MDRGKLVVYGFISGCCFRCDQWGRGSGFERVRVIRDRKDKTMMWHNVSTKKCILKSEEFPRKTFRLKLCYLVWCGISTLSKLV